MGSSILGGCHSRIIKMHKGMLRWFGHVERMEDERLTKKIYNAKACERRSRGRPRLTYEDQIKRVLSDGKIKSTRHRRKCMKGLMSVEEAKEICKSREKWNNNNISSRHFPCGVSRDTLSSGTRCIHFTPEDSCST